MTNTETMNVNGEDVVKKKIRHKYSKEIYEEAFYAKKNVMDHIDDLLEVIDLDNLSVLREKIKEMDYAERVVISLGKFTRQNTLWRMIIPTTKDVMERLTKYASHKIRKNYYEIHLSYDNTAYYEHDEAEIDRCYRTLKGYFHPEEIEGQIGIEDMEEEYFN